MKKSELIKDFMLDHVIAITLILLLVLSLLLINYYVTSPENIKNGKIRELNHNQTQLILLNPKISCDQIMDLRTKHFQALTWETDPLFYSQDIELSKTLWNVKNCGHVLGWLDP